MSVSATSDLPAPRHHFVPRFLLAGFTPSERKNDQIWVFDAMATQARRLSPTAVGHEDGYYAVEVPRHASDIAEKFFAKVEYHAVSIIREMVKAKALPTGEQFGYRLYFLGLMFGRSPAMRKSLIDFYEGTMHMFLQVATVSPDHWEATIRGMPPGKKRLSFEVAKAWAEEDHPL